MPQCVEYQLRDCGSTPTALIEQQQGRLLQQGTDHVERRFIRAVF